MTTESQGRQLSQPHFLQPTASPGGRGAGRTPSAEELTRLWAAYLADRGDLKLRNRLVELYAPWAADVARSLANRMAILDRENAVGDVLAALVESIVPGYDGCTGFRRWARVCIRRKLIDQERADRNAEAVFSRERFCDVQRLLPELLPDRERPDYDLKFAELTAELSDAQATVLWLTHYRGTPVNAIAELLKVTRRSVCGRLREAVAALRAKWAHAPEDERSAL